MSQKSKKNKTTKRDKIRVYALNCLGVLLLCLVPIIGPLPGPGGFPLTIAGLSLLAINNVWAQKLKDYIEEKGVELGDLIFLENKKIQLAWDIFSFVGFAAVAFVWLNFNLNTFGLFALTTTSSILLICVFRNRSRWRKLVKYCKKTFKSKKSSKKN